MKHLFIASALLLSANAHANPVCQNPGISDQDGDGWGWENNTSCRVVTNSGQVTVTGESDFAAQLQALTARVAALETRLNGTESQPANNSSTASGSGFYNDTPRCQTAVSRINANAHQLIGKNQQQVQALIGKPQKIDSSSSGSTVTIRWEYSDDGRWYRPVITFQNGVVRTFDSDFSNSYCS